jgi:hypothetical protein
MQEYQNIGDEGWVRMNRSALLLEVMAKNQSAFCLLALMAFRTWRGPSIDRHGCQVGEAFIGNYAELGLTQQKYRVAKKHLEDFGLCTFRGTSRATIGRIVTKDVFDLGIEPEVSDRNAAA